MEKKQSSIDWLENEIDFILTTYSYNSQDFHLVKAFEQAKAMHKEEIRVAYMDGALEKIRHSDGKQFMMPTDYHNQTFGGNNEKTQ